MRIDSRRWWGWWLGAACAVILVILSGLSSQDGVVAQSDSTDSVPVGPVRPVDERLPEGVLEIVNFHCSAIEGNFSAVAGPSETATVPTDDATCQRGDASFLVADDAAEAAVATAGADGVVRLTGLAEGKGIAIDVATGNTVTFDIAPEARTVVTFWTEVDARGEPSNTISAASVAGGEWNARGSGDLTVGQGDDLGDIVQPALSMIVEPTVAPPVVIDAGQVVSLSTTGEGNAGGGGDALVFLIALVALLLLGAVTRWRQPRVA